MLPTAGSKRVSNGQNADRKGGLVRLALLLFTVIFCATILINGTVGGQDTGDSAEAASNSMFSTMELVYWGLLLVGAVAALVQARLFYVGMKQADEGNETMIEIAGHVREGAGAYLRQQYKVVGIFMVIVSALLFWAGQAGVQEKLVFIAFLTGGFYSGLAGFIGMKTATQASSRTAAGAQKSLNEGLQVAFRSGAVMGLTVVGLGMLDMAIWYMILKFWYNDVLPNTGIIINTMLCSLMGASSQALFARVGGGIFTKAADVGADLVGKVEAGIPEDDPRNPATIADNVGDNVGDVAGMGADLYESYCGSILATAALGVSAAAATSAFGVVEAVFLPMLVASFGTIISIVGIYLVQAGEDASQKALLGVIGFGINMATVGVIFLALLLSYVLLGTISVGISIIVGLASGWLIGKWTEYATSDEFSPTQKLAGQAITGPATVIIGGVADGMKSVWVPILIICAGTISAFGFANGWNFSDVGAFSLGLYGVGIAAVGMLSTLGITLATDAYGPIADNAGGNAEMSGLEPVVRERTDALDSLGNTTAATGKGFAIGSAALTALALLAAYVEQVRVGFERWSHSLEDQVVAGQLDQGMYKLSNGFVVNVADKTDESGVEANGYLIMPEAFRTLREESREEWSELKASPVKPAEIKSDMIEFQEVEKTVKGEKTKQVVPVLKESGFQLVSVKQATLPDFAQYYNASLLNPMVLVGIFLGCMATFVFCAMTMQAVGRAAQGMVEEVRRQFREKPGIMNGTEQPDYSRPVEISTIAAQREMLLPSLLGLITPVVVGMLLGVGGVIGLLVGTLTCGFCVAIFMANAGGAWDNAKKYIEAGHLEKDGEVHAKGSEAHKAAVVGDTVGDPFKDTSGPSLNILIKLMSIVSVVAAGFVVRFCLINWL